MGVRGPPHPTQRQLFDKTFCQFPRSLNFSLTAIDFVGGGVEGWGGTAIIPFSDTSFLLIGIRYDVQSFRLINQIISGVLCYFHGYVGSLGSAPGRSRTPQDEHRPLTKLHSTERNVPIICNLQQYCKHAKQGLLSTENTETYAGDSFSFVRLLALRPLLAYRRQLQEDENDIIG
jgi:hypothetical protein